MYASGGTSGLWDGSRHPGTLRASQAPRCVDEGRRDGRWVKQHLQGVDGAGAFILRTLAITLNVVIALRGLEGEAFDDGCDGGDAFVSYNPAANLDVDRDVPVGGLRSEIQNAFVPRSVPTLNFRLVIPN